MDIATFISNIRAELDEPESSYLSDEQIVRWANQAQRLVCARLRLFYDTSGAEVTAGTPDYEIPNLLGVERALFYTGSLTGAQTTLKRMDLRRLLDELKTTDTGTPYYYAHDVPNRRVVLFPTPSENGVLMIYGHFLPDNIYYDPNNPETNVDPTIPEEHLELLNLWIKYKFAAMQEDLQLASYYKDAFDREIREARSVIYFAETDGAPEIQVDYY